MPISYTYPRARISESYYNLVERKRRVLREYIDSTVPQYMNLYKNVL